MSQVTNDVEIQSRLGKPGAGLPWYQLFFLRLYIKPFVMRRASWESCEQQFKRSREKIRDEVTGIPPVQLIRRVLVEPQPGLEDSSRYWSVAMTVRHLTIVGSRMEQAIIALSNGRDPGFVADTGKVKPETESNLVSSVGQFFHFSDRLLARLHESIGDRNARGTFYHPWFGQMYAKDWLWLLGTHQFLHLKQIRAIKRALESQREEAEQLAQRPH